MKLTLVISPSLEDRRNRVARTFDERAFRRVGVQFLPLWGQIPTGLLCEPAQRDARLS